MGMKGNMGAGKGAVNKAPNPMGGLKGGFTPDGAYSGVLRDTPDAAKHMKGIGGGSKLPGSKPVGTPTNASPSVTVKGKH